MFLAELVTAASAATNVDDGADPTTRRILDAAVTEAAAVGIRRITVEDVVRRARVSRMTAYRRFRSRDDLVEALVHRETQRFLAVVADASDVVDAFVSAVRFCRRHPILRNAPHHEPTPHSDTAALLPIGVQFIVEQLNEGRPHPPTREMRWVADVFARLFLTFISVPPTDPDLDDDAQLREYAQTMLTPMVQRVV